MLRSIDDMSAFQELRGWFLLPVGTS
ncbi:hypothetical protein SBBP2_460039 [Burkholderiales bacterium]|nr:hypothetical protein SBBP2_460039 [Burkholderiales bacterium]